MADFDPPYATPPTLPDNTPTYPELPPEPEGSWLARNRKSAILGGIVVLLAGAIGVTALIRRSPAGTQTVQNTNQVVTETTNTQGPATTNRATFRRYQATVTPDQDNDGLSDDEERQAGTKTDVADSDGDGLNDFDEVKVYRTDPLKPDTDADGKTDGQEVAAGTNPNGPGLLLNTSQAISNLNNTNQ